MCAVNHYRSSFFFLFFKKKSTVNANFLSRVNLEVCLQKGTQLSCSQASCLAVLPGSRQSHTVCTYSVGEEEEDPRGTTSQAIYTSSPLALGLRLSWKCEATWVCCVRGIRGHDIPKGRSVGSGSQAREAPVRTQTTVSQPTQSELAGSVRVFTPVHTCTCSRIRT